MIDIRLPNITATTEKGQLEQIRSYLYQFAEQLNWALGNIDSKAEEATKMVAASTKDKDAVEEAQETFSEVKSLIIKSADIVNAYYEEINHRLEGVYVAQSDFGTYKQESSATISATSENIGILFENQQTLQTNVGGLSDSIDSVGDNVAGINEVLQTDESCTTILGSQAWVKIGVLDYEASGFPIYGMEIGQTNKEGEDTVYNRYAQYRSDGVHLYDQNNIEVATISDYKLKITNAEMIHAVITSSLKIGGYSVSTDNGLAFKWGGGA